MNTTSTNLRRRGVSCTNCCVVGCHNNYTNTDESVSFYNFPARQHEQEHRALWIQSVKRNMLSSRGNDSWQPKKFSKICSKHFLGNSKSNHPLSLSYIPTIFPKEYGNKEKIASFEHKKRRYERFIKKTHRRTVASANTNTIIFHNEDAAMEEQRASNFSCQVSFENEEASFNFECIFSARTNEVATQANISEKRDRVFKEYSEKQVGTDSEIELNCKGFHGNSSIKNSDELNSLGGVCFERFKFLKSLLIDGHGNDKLVVENKLLLFLMKMKLGISYCALGVLFGIHRSTASRIFICILTELTQKSRKLVYWPTRDVIENTMPQAFKMNYPNCRVIIDCTELKVEHPNTVDKRIYMYSNYKSAHTAKFFIGMAPNGFISFISKCYGGRSSDSFITNDSGFLSSLEPGDLVLADKGFPGIECEDGVVVVVPPFVHDGMLTEEEVERTYSIASVRIHVERSIQRIKVHDILQKVPSSLLPFIDDIVFMCCVLTNLQSPTIREV